MLKESSLCYNNVFSSHLIVVVVGFVDTMIEVNETDGNATLNVSISFPQPMPGVRELQIMFTLLVNSMDGSAGRDGIFQCRDFLQMCSTMYPHYQIYF